MKRVRGERRGRRKTNTIVMNLLRQGDHEQARDVAESQYQRDRAQAQKGAGKGASSSSSSAADWTADNWWSGWHSR